MLFMGLIRWWYSDGWLRRARIVSAKLDSSLDYFSMGLLVKTLFSPFRQISAGRTDGPIGVQLRAFADKLISRLIGAIVRICILLVGAIVIVFQVLIGFLILVFWAAIPILPLIGLVMAIIGVSV